MSLAGQAVALAQAIGADVKSLLKASPSSTTKTIQPSQLSIPVQNALGKAAALVDKSQLVTKTVAQSYTSSTATNTDPEIIFPVAANGVYRVRGTLYYTANSGGDLKFGFMYPSGRIDGWWQAPQSAGTSTTIQATVPQKSPVHLSGGQTTASANFGVAGGVATTTPIEATVDFDFVIRVGATGGSLQLCWGQSTSISTATTLLAYSNMVVDQITGWPAPGTVIPDDTGTGPLVNMLTESFTGTNGAAPSSTYTPITKNGGTVTIQNNALVLAPTAAAWNNAAGVFVSGMPIVGDAEYLFNYQLTSLSEQYPIIGVRARTSDLWSGGAGDGMPKSGYFAQLRPAANQIGFQGGYTAGTDIDTQTFQFPSTDLMVRVQVLQKMFNIKIWARLAQEPQAWTYSKPIAFDQSAGQLILTAGNGPAAVSQAITIDNLVYNTPQLSIGPSVSAPVTNPTGFKLAFSENFDTPAAANTAIGTGTSAFLTTYQNSFQPYDDAGEYWPSSQISAHDGVMDVYMDGSRGAAGSFGTPAKFATHVGGKFSMRVKVLGAIGNGSAVMIWPTSEVWDDGELDYPEANFEDAPYVHHHIMNNNNQDQASDDYNTGASWRDWHVYSAEWHPGTKVDYFLDDVLVHTVTANVPTVAHRYMFQVGNYGAVGHMYIDWVAIWDLAS